jgi:hypothetical protein
LLSDIAQRLIGRQLIKVAIGAAELEPHDTNNALDELTSVHKRAQLADAAGINVSDVCFKKSVLRLVRQADEENSSRDAPWRKAIKLLGEDGQPELLVTQDGMILELAKREWVTRRLFVLTQPDNEESAVRRIRAAAKNLGYLP